MRAGLPLLTVVLATAAVSASAQQIAVGNWVGRSYYDSAGRFTHCAIGARYVSGIHLVFSINRAWNIVIGLGHPEWKMSRGAQYNVMFQIDDRIAQSAIATVANTDLAFVEFPRSRAFFEQLKWGRLLRVTSGDQTFSFAMTSTAAALDQLASCVHANIANISPGAINPYAPPPRPPAPAPGISSAPPVTTAAQNREKIVTLMANLFIQAGVTGMQMLSAEETPEAVKQYDLAWRGPNLIGAAKYIAPARGVSAKAITDDIVASDAKSCPGKFLTGVRPDDSQDGVRFRRMFVNCEDLFGTVTRMYYVVFGTSDKGYYVIGNASREAEEKLNDVDNSIAKIALQQVRLH